MAIFIILSPVSLSGFVFACVLCRVLTAFNVYNRERVFASSYKGRSGRCTFHADVQVGVMSKRPVSSASAGIIGKYIVQFGENVVVVFRFETWKMQCARGPVDFGVNENRHSGRDADHPQHDGYPDGVFTRAVGHRAETLRNGQVAVDAHRRQ